MEDLNVYIVQRAKELNLSKTKTLQLLAQEVGVTPTTIWRYLNKSRRPGNKECSKLRQITHGRVTGDSFYGRETP